VGVGKFYQIPQLGANLF